MKTSPTKEQLEEFKEELRPYLTDYSRDVLNDFYKYWVGHNKRKHTKWDEKTFDIKRRLVMWTRNSNIVYPTKNKINKLKNTLKHFNSLR